MKLHFNGLVCLALAFCAVPAVAGENDCVATSDSTLGKRLADQFFYEEGLGQAPAPYFEQLQATMQSCITQYSVPDEIAQIFTELNVANAMRAELAGRLRAAGVDVAKLDRGMVPHIPSASTTYDQMFDSLGPEFDAAVDKLEASGKMRIEMAEGLIGAYTGAFHSAYVSQLQWDARK